MDILKLSGVAAIVGSLLFLIVPFLTPGLYQLSPEQRVQFLEANRSTVLFQNISLIIAGFLVAGAFVAWSTQLGDEAPGFLWKSGSALMVLAAIFLGLFFWQTTRDPASYHLADSMSLPGNLYFIAAIGAFAIYSFLFIWSSIPNWLGYLTGLVTALMLLGFLFIGGKDLPPQPFFLVSLIAGMVFLAV